MQTLATEKHPTEMLFGPDEKTLFVACANSTRVSVVNLADGKGLETINCALYASALAGNTPNSLSMTPDGQLLFVANADNNTVAMFNVAKPGDAKPLGFIPTGFYPTSVRYNPSDKKLYIANGRGASTHANPNGPRPDLPKGPSIREYIAGLYRGTLGIVDLPDEETMVKYSKQAYECSPLRADLEVTMKAPEGQSDPGQGRPAESDQVLHLRHPRKPDLRPGLRRHQGRQRRPEPVHLPGKGHAERPSSGPAIRAAGQFLLRRRSLGRRARMVDGGLLHRLGQTRLAS